ncbi:hypothetical protein [Salibacterium lacus]|uniref:Uncharacterized protein n=1 Tax=Salibacterium lacus TaxID=1898109 RepID=A0ABW5T4G2_9BACI
MLLDVVRRSSFVFNEFFFLTTYSMMIGITIARTDVAATLAALLHEPRIGR